MNIVRITFHNFITISTNENRFHHLHSKARCTIKCATISNAFSYMSCITIYVTFLETLRDLVRVQNYILIINFLRYCGKIVGCTAATLGGREMSIIAKTSRWTISKPAAKLIIHRPPCLPATGDGGIASRRALPTVRTVGVPESLSRRDISSLYDVH